MAKYFLKLTETLSHRFKKHYAVNPKHNQYKETTLKFLVVKVMKTIKTDKILKAARGKGHTTFKGTT